MAGYCTTFLFFSYASTAVIYFILAIFGCTGNVALLTENYRYNSNQALEAKEEENVKGRVIGQYFIASALSLIISVLLFFFTMREKPSENQENLSQTFSLDIQQQDSNIINQTPNENNIIEMPTPNSEINTNTINSENNLSLGMNEKDSL